MRRFVDRVKAGNWVKTLEAVATLGVVATSVGVSVGVAAAQPLAKDLAKGLADVAAVGMQAVSEVCGVWWLGGARVGRGVACICHVCLCSFCARDGVG